ncbi:MAG: hypothetical protein ACRECX_15270 [Methyloceanibacter sp.]|uniref:hypothetical protein n=1 Tax=Methyloceanibacter sp. TaxID=1965321 RepID=UPI003D6D6B0D
MTFDIRLRLHWATGFLAVLVAASLPHASFARDGVTGCSVAEVDAEQGRVWRYTIELQVPQGGHCRVYISEDRDRKSWTYCWLKAAAQNPVSATCDDPLDDADFVDWKARALCGDQSFMAYCQRQQ